MNFFLYCPICSFIFHTQPRNRVPKKPITISFAGGTMDYERDSQAKRAEINWRETLTSSEPRYKLRPYSLAIPLRRPFLKGEHVLSRVLEAPSHTLFIYQRNPASKPHISQPENGSRLASKAKSQKCRTKSEMNSAM